MKPPVHFTNNDFQLDKRIRTQDEIDYRNLGRSLWGLPKQNNKDDLSPELSDDSDQDKMGFASDGMYHDGDQLAAYEDDTINFYADTHKYDDC